MRRWISLAAVAACSSPPPAAPKPADFDALVNQVLDDMLANDPMRAVGLGLHDRDGQLPDISPAALTTDLVRTRSNLAALEAIDVKTLAPKQRETLDTLEVALRNDLFDREELDDPHTNPLRYASFGLDSYVVRPYAPVAQRAAAFAKVCNALPAYLDQARKNLRLPMPRTWIDIALLMTKGTIDFVDHDAREQLGDQPALATCKSALADQVAWLEQQAPHGTTAYALGKDKFLGMLAADEGFTITLPALQKLADDTLARDTQALAEAAKQIDPNKTPAEVVAALADDRPTDTLAAATEQAAQLRQFLIDHHIVTVPPDETCEVRASPAFQRWNAAFMDGPGPFEHAKLPYFYYISPPDPTWPPEEQRAYLMPRGNLLFTTAHEVYPGHFIQALHQRRNPSRATQMLGSYMTGEGWAHYAEQMMYDEGAGGHTPQAHIGQLTEALLRDVRFVVAIGEHTGGMTVEQAEALFTGKAFQDPGNAHQQAVRGTFDPMFLSYTVGKLAIMKLRTDWMAKHPSATLCEFHDEFLAHAPEPMSVIRRAMLGDDSPIL
ncbi:MAG TPA: DUF885 domain-containing protein [Kofleriaceae bacterium]|jgi:uncharacterized protein (DUF885 family)